MRLFLRLQKEALILNLIAICFSVPETKTLEVRSHEWFSVAGKKILLVTQALVVLRAHEHFRVRKELAIYCSRLMLECDM